MSDNTVVITLEEYHLLYQKAAAYDALVKARLHEGYVPGQVVIQCEEAFDDALILRISNWTIITPFGKGKISTCSPDIRQWKLRNGASVILETLVQLNIN